ncbi:MAG: hypothetical protein AAFU79_00530 [Myxococcota bacterium]
MDAIKAHDWDGLLKSVVAQDGPVTADVLKKYAAKTPAIFVTVDRVKGLQDVGGETWGCARCELYVVTSVANCKKRGEVALAIAGDLASLVHKNCWDLENVKGADGTEARNLYSLNLDKAGLTAWAVGFEQWVRCEVPDISTLRDFLGVDAYYDLKDTTGHAQTDAVDNIDLPQ